MVSITDLLASSREPTPTPSEVSVYRLAEKNFRVDIKADQSFYASHLGDISHNTDSAPSNVTFQNCVSKEHPAWLTPGDANLDKDLSRLNMPDAQQHSAPSDPTRQSDSPSRASSRPSSRSNFSRRFPSRSSFQIPNVQSFALTPSSSTDASVASTSQHPAFTPIPPYPSPAPYSQASGYVGQYATSNPPPHMSIISAPYSYVHPHGYNPPDMSQSTHIGYPASPMVPMMQPPMYQYQASDGNANVSSHSFSGAPPSTLYTHMNSSPPPHSPLSSQGPGGPQHSAPYTSPTPYSPIYPNPSHFPYPNQSYPPSNMYQSAYPHPPYPSVYGTEQDSQRSWWYVSRGPHSGQFENIQPHYHQGHYSIPFSPPSSREAESYSQAGPSYSQSSHHQQRRISQPQGVSEPQDRPPQPPPSSPPVSPTSAGVGASLKPDPPLPQGSFKERSNVVRRAYHPNNPSQRSEWVMWAGNVPSDATHDELWRFFNQPPNPGTSTLEDVGGGVSSIFLIARSNCAFVNFETEEHLQAAILHFSGHQIRPGDPKCPHLVCRVRRKDDDLKAGVGGQRGVGLHVKWIQQQKGKADDREIVPVSPSALDNIESSLASVSTSSDDDGGSSPHRLSAAHSNSSGSYASTTSSLLTQYFPKRYFILKSLTQFDLDLSVERGVWATQPHNEGILDQAYRTSAHVYLIFGVNKSGEFYGYARMAGPIARTQTKIPWASRTDSPASSRSSQSGLILSPTEKRLSENSPTPLSPETGLRQSASSAPAELHQSHSKPSLDVPRLSSSLDQAKFALPSLPEDFHLDRNAPTRALRHSPVNPSSNIRDTRSRDAEPMLEALLEEDERHGAGGEGSAEMDGERGVNNTSWGQPFKIEWIHTDRLPFYRTRHLRNPWNHDREIKVSRDGTEIEPSVGQILLDEWDCPDPSSSIPPSRPLGVSKREIKNPSSSSQKGRKEKHGLESSQTNQ